MELDLDLLEKHLDSIYTKITKIEKELKTLKKSDQKHPKMQRYAHSAFFDDTTSKKSSPYNFLRNNQQHSQILLPKTNSGIFLVPAPIISILSTDSSGESDSYSSHDEYPSDIVSIEVHKSLPKDWNLLILQHNKEIENITFDNIRKVTSEDINLLF